MKLSLSYYHHLIVPKGISECLLGWNLIISNPLFLGCIGKVLRLLVRHHFMENKTKYFRLRRYDEVWLLSCSLLSALWMLLECSLSALSHPEVILICSKWIWAEMMKNDCSRALCAGRTDGQTDKVTPWAPCRSQKFKWNFGYLTHWSFNLVGWILWKSNFITSMM